MALTPRRVLSRVVMIWAALVALLVAIFVDIPCLPDGFRYGYWPETCAVRARLDVTLQASGLARGQEGQVTVGGDAVWGTADGGVARGWLRRGVDVRLSLRDGAGAEVAAPEVRRAGWSAGAWRAGVRLPDVPDGDYALVAEVSTRDDARTVELPLPLYARALVHALPDRPLVRPGDELRVRSVTLRAADRTPVADRPGRWDLVDPSGRVMWTEKGRTSAFGIADTVFALDGDAQQGPWKVRWASGDQVAEATVRVEVFDLPPYALELAPDRPWYRPGDALRIEGAARYRNGAPVGGAEVVVSVESRGEWPVPLAWSDLHDVTADAGGRFMLDLGPVPEDLVGRVVIGVTATARADGAIVEGGAEAILSAEGLWIDALTELGGGLVGGVNNRAWLHVRTPDGAGLGDRDLVVRVPGSASLPDRAARSDADGVVGLNLDPGRPVTVVLPGRPTRVRAEAPRPTLAALRSADGSADDRRRLEALAADLAPCLPSEGDEQVDVLLRVDAGGRVTRAAADGPLGACVAGRLEGRSLAPGEVRTLETTWSLPEPWLARVTAARAAFAGDEAIERSLLGALPVAARACAPTGPDDAASLGVVHWSAAAGGAPRVDAAQLAGPPGVGACVVDRLARLEVGRADRDTFGALTLGLAPGARPPSARAQPPQTREGYELEVEVAGERGRVVLPVGSVPALRLRAEPPIVDPGGEVVVELVRGPSFSGELPERLELVQGPRVLAKGAVDPERRAATLTVPGSARGLAEVAWGGARVVVLVRDPRALAVALTPGAERCRPGDRATVEVVARVGGAGAVAAVGLSGVDEGLGQLATLPGPMALAEDMVRLPGAEPVFSYSPTDLLLGRVAGAEAARAVLMRVGSIGQEDGGEVVRSGRASAAADLDLELARSFWRARGRLVADVRAWEVAAPEGAQLRPADVAARWSAALDALDAAGTPASDAFGRRLELVLLPPPLLERLDPRALVSDATRLAEDEQSWTLWVDRRLR